MDFGFGSEHDSWSTSWRGGPFYDGDLSIGLYGAGADLCTQPTRGGQFSRLPIRTLLRFIRNLAHLRSRSCSSFRRRGLRLVKCFNVGSSGFKLFWDGFKRQFLSTRDHCGGRRCEHSGLHVFQCEHFRNKPSLCLREKFSHFAVYNLGAFIFYCAHFTFCDDVGRRDSDLQ